MKRAALALLLAAACGPARPSSEPQPTPVATAVASSSPAAVSPPIADAGAPAAAFKIVREAIHPTEKRNPFIARLGERETGTAKLAPVDPKVGALSGDAAATVCYVATGLTSDMDATCSAKIDSVTDATVAATVEVGFEDDTMQSRAKTRVTMTGAVTLDASRAVLRASFRGRETFAERPPCEKNEGCDACDPLVRKAGCAAKCYCPFRPAGTADVETSYGR